MPTQVDWETQIKNKPVARVVYSAEYQFTQSPAATLTGGIASSVTLSPLPPGIDSTVSPNKHYIRIIGGTSTETCLITDVTGSTVTFTTMNNYTSGNWSINSATDGIQEALGVAYINGGEVVVGARNNLSPNYANIYAPIRLYGGQSLTGTKMTRLIRMFGGTDPLIYQDGAGPYLTGGGIANLAMGYGPGVTIETTAFCIHIKSCVSFIIDNIFMSVFGSGILLESAQNTLMSNITQEYFTGTAIKNDAVVTTLVNWIARTFDNNVVFYHHVNGFINMSNWTIQGGGLIANNTKGLYASSTGGFYESIFTNGEIDSIVIGIDLSACLDAHSLQFSNIKMLSGQLRGAGICDTFGSTVTFVSGIPFTGITAGMPFVINGSVYEVATVLSSTSLTLTTSVGPLTGATFISGGRWAAIILPSNSTNVSFNEIDIYGCANTGGIIQVYGGDNINFRGVRINDTVDDINGSVGIAVAGAVTNMSIHDCVIGYSAGAVSNKISHAIILYNFAHSNVSIKHCRLYGVIKMIADLGDGSYLRVTNNIGIDDVLQPVSIDSNIVNTQNPLCNLIALTGTATVTSITGAAPGRDIYFVKGDSGTITFAGGNIGISTTLTSTNGMIRFKAIGGLWFPV